MRDRLIELIQDAVNGCARNWAEIIADHLLANGVIVLQAENANLTSHLTSLQNDLTSAKAEVDRLRDVVEKTDAAYFQKVGEVDSAKADAIKVRCKDCKHRHKVNTGLAIWQVCHRLNRQTDDDFYCAYGERKDDNAD